MARFGVVLSFTFAVLTQGETLHDSKGSRLIRKDPVDGRSIQLTSSGEFTVHKDITKDTTLDFCGLDFVWGKVDQNLCDDRANHTESDLTRAKCEWAAGKAGAVIHAETEMISPLWENSHPYGCFMFPCADGQCYYYNEAGSTPTSPEGLPVCERPRYIYGKPVPGSLVNDSSMCTNVESGGTQEANGQYRVVDTELACQKAASCLGLCSGQYFHVDWANATESDNYPPGCFLNSNHSSGTTNTPCVYFNPALDGTPTNPVGKPICVVANPDKVGTTTFPAGYGNYAREAVLVNKSTNSSTTS